LKNFFELEIVEAFLKVKRTLHQTSFSESTGILDYKDIRGASIAGRNHLAVLIIIKYLPVIQKRTTQSVRYILNLIFYFINVF